MKVVINIPEKAFELLKNKSSLNVAEAIIAGGTPLPKGHGPIKDVSQIEIPMCEDRSYEKWVQVSIDAAPTIIEADTGETE